jgi:hypothetical protein
LYTSDIVQLKRLKKVKNLAKKRNSTMNVTTPTLYTKSDTVLEAIELLRDNISTFTYRSSSEIITKKLYSYVSEHWQDIAPEWLKQDRDKFKKARSIYALATEYTQNKGDNRISFMGYMSKILGHKENDIITQASYYKATIID